MKVTIHSYEEHEPAVLAQCMERLYRFYGPNVNPATPDADIYVQARDSRGWLEYGLALRYAGGGQIRIHAISRNAGEPVEFHS